MDKDLIREKLVAIEKMFFIFSLVGTVILAVSTVIDFAIQERIIYPTLATGFLFIFGGFLTIKEAMKWYDLKKARRNGEFLIIVWVVVLFGLSIAQLALKVARPEETYDISPEFMTAFKGIIIGYFTTFISTLVNLFIEKTRLGDKVKGSKGKTRPSAKK